MAFEQRHTDLLELYHDKFGLPALDGASARDWTYKLGQQFNFAFPSEGWGTKKASNTSPQSTDVICTRVPFDGYDVIKSQGSPSQSLNPNPDAIHLTGSGQIFIDTPPANYLSDVPPVEPVPPNPPTSPVIPYDEAKSIEFGHGCNAVYAESGAPFDPGMVSVHSSRAAWDYYVGGLSWEDTPESNPGSYRKHINEFRAVYGLPPV